jgi:hypothetical protein
MPYTLSEVVPETCQRLGPFATSSEAAGTPCPAGTSFHSYAAEGEKTVKVCCPQPARLSPVASVNAPEAPVTPLDCPKGTYFVAMETGASKCVYCFRTAGNEACPGIPGVGRYKAPATPPAVVLPAIPVVTPVVSPVMPVVSPVTVVTESGLMAWLQSNWKWLAALGVGGAVAYHYTKQQKVA